MTNLSRDVLEKIKDEKIEPRPKWHFFVIHSLLWASVVISIILGAIATAIFLRHSLNSEWIIRHHFTSGNVRAAIMLLPYFWFLFIGLIIYLAGKLFSQTKTGYRIRSVFVAAGSVVISLILGTGFYMSHLDQPLEDKLIYHLPYYQKRQDVFQKKLVAPGMGVLAGEIIAINPRTRLMLLDFAGIKWEVDLQDALHRSLKEGMKVGVLGKQTGDFSFKAKIVEPLRR